MKKYFLFQQLLLPCCLVWLHRLDRVYKPDYLALGGQVMIRLLFFKSTRIVCIILMKILLWRYPISLQATVCP